MSFYLYIKFNNGKRARVFDLSLIPVKKNSTTWRPKLFRNDHKLHEKCVIRNRSRPSIYLIARRDSILAVAWVTNPVGHGRIDDSGPPYVVFSHTPHLRVTTWHFPSYYSWADIISALRHAMSMRFNYRHRKNEIPKKQMCHRHDLDWTEFKLVYSRCAKEVWTLWWLNG